MVDIPIRNEGYIKAREKAVVAIDTASIDETVKQQLLRLDRGMPWYEPVVSVRRDDAALEYFLSDNACVRIRCRVGVGARKPKAVQARSALLTVSFQYRDHDSCIPAVLGTRLEHEFTTGATSPLQIDESANGRAPRMLEQHWSTGRR